MADFVARAREALTIGSERVRTKYGYGCGRGCAMAQIEAIETKAAAEGADGPVIVDGFDR